MKTISRYLSSILAAAALLLMTAVPAYAANFPMLTLSNSGTSVQIIVSNGDPNVPVTFYYPSGGSTASVNIGTTNSSGYLTATINPGTYGISNGNPVYVNVDGERSASATWPNLATSGSSASTIYLTQTTATLQIGQSTTISASNITGSVNVSGNNNPSVANTTLSGNNIIINGISSGTAVLTICDTGSGSCGTVNVTVQPSYLSTPAVYLTPSNLSMNVGQTQTVAIGGYTSGPFFVSSNTGSGAVSASVNNSNLILTGLSNGTSNVTVCSTSNQCGTVFVNVTSNGTSGNTTTTSSNLPLALASFSISSGNQNNGFIANGNPIIITMSANQQINNPTIQINGNNILVNGSGSGPYTASYTLTGSESMPLPVIVSFTNSNGASASNYFWVGNSGAAPANTSSSVTTTSTNGAQTSATLSTCPVGLTCVPISNPTPVPASTPVVSSSGGYQFNNYLYIDMTPQGAANPDVSALQQRLANDGFFSGAVTGYFGPVTKAAVIAYQAKHGLSQLGVVGPATRTLLNQGI